MTQHIQLVWVHDAESKAFQRGSWWVNYVQQFRPKCAQGMIQNFVLQHPKEQHSVWVSLVRITLCLRPVAGARFCSAPTCSPGNPSTSQSKTNACFADHLLLLAYSGFVFNFRILFSGHTADHWALSQPNNSLLRCHPPCNQKSLDLFHLDNFDYQVASHYSFQ